MSIELPRQPTGPGQSCYKCGAYFAHTPGNPRGRQCHDCRNKGKRSPNAGRPVVPVRDKTHTDAWNDRSLGEHEARYLIQAWGARAVDKGPKTCATM